MRLITLEYAKKQIQMDHDDDDLLISMYIEAASESIVSYLKDGAAVFLDSSGEVEYDEFGEPVGVPKKVQVATMLYVGILYRNRDENPDDLFEYGNLPHPIMSMLYQMRTPALA